MTIGYVTTLRNARLDAVTTAIGNGGKLNIYDGTRPATGAAVTTQNLLAQGTLGSPFAPAAASGALAPNLPAAFNGAIAGTATWFRITTSGGTAVLDGSVSTSGADLNLNSTSVLVGTPITINSWGVNTGNA